VLQLALVLCCAVAVIAAAAAAAASAVIAVVVAAAVCGVSLCPLLYLNTARHNCRLLLLLLLVLLLLLHSQCLQYDAPPCTCSVRCAEAQQTAE
jgi:hypothetical protein